MEAILQFDTDLLLLLNSMRSALFNNFFWIYTSVIIWIPFYLVLAYVIILRMGLKGIWVLLAIGLTIVLCDQISSSVFKPLFERVRPSREPNLEGILQLIHNYRGGRFGFVSGHATNSFGLLTFVVFLFKKRFFTIFIYIWALINVYSRIYAGVHYPGDILFGIILGSLIGWGMYKLYNYLSKKNSFISYQGAPFGKEVWLSVQAGVFSIIMIFLSSLILLKIMV